jgi:ubiquinone/menaquinone biosynthesis C-methylase UbiE
MVNDPEVIEKMRAEWNERASEDAHYYVAFGKREQDDEGFFATGADVVRALETELKRIPQAKRALEIGCGPGRLMRPMARHFHEIHGIDISDEMIRRAERNLAGTANAYPKHATASDLAGFADASFDFVYSYAVFQHIPSGDVVFGYLREVARVLRPGGIAHLQLNGLPKTSQTYTTWSGFRVSADEVREFAREHSMQLLALDGEGTQYMWTTWRKKAPMKVRAISNAHSGEHAVPSHGRLACASLWIENLPEACDLNSLEARVDGLTATGVYVGPCVNGLSQFNILLPPGTRTGLVPVTVSWGGEPLTTRAWMRVIPPGPAVPRVESVTDGTNLLSDRRIESGTVKVQLEEIASPESFEARIDGRHVRAAEMFCTDPRNQRYDVSFLLPEDTAVGLHHLEMNLGARKLAPIPIEVV